MEASVVGSIYEAPKGFVVVIPTQSGTVNKTLISYNTGNGILCGIVKDDTQTKFLFNFRCTEQERSSTWDGKRKLIRFGMSFEYKTGTRNLCCFNRSERKCLAEKRIETRQQLWEDENEGPYTVLRIQDVAVNPCKELSFVFHDGSFMPSDPPQIDILFPTKHLDAVKQHIGSLKSFKIDLQKSDYRIN